MKQREIIQEGGEMRMIKMWKCGSTDCAHNEDGECQLESISIDDEAMCDDWEEQ